MMLVRNGNKKLTSNAATCKIEYSFLNVYDVRSSLKINYVAGGAKAKLVEI